MYPGFCAPLRNELPKRYPMFSLPPVSPNRQRLAPRIFPAVLAVLVEASSILLGSPEKIMSLEGRACLQVSPYRGGHASEGPGREMYLDSSVLFILIQGVQDGWRTVSRPAWPRYRSLRESLASTPAAAACFDPKPRHCERASA